MEDKDTLADAIDDNDAATEESDEGIALEDIKKQEDEEKKDLVKL